MNIFKSKWFIGLICFVLGIGAMFVMEKLKPKHDITFLGANPPHLIRDMDPLFDEFFSNDSFGKASDPFEQMRNMRKQMLKQFAEPDEGGGIFDSWYKKKFGGGNADEIKKREDKNFIYYDVAIRDLDKEKVDVKVADGQISISGRTEKKSDENGNSSFYSSSFHRSFPVPAEVDSTKFQTEQSKDGLTLKFPKTVGA